MQKITQILENSLLKQLALEEDLHKNIEQHLFHSGLNDYPEAKEMLGGIKHVLEKHYDNLNLSLDEITREKNIENSRFQKFINNDSNNMNGANEKKEDKQVSKILYEDYLALNLAIIGNTFLHTTALAANFNSIANTALDHLENLTQYVILMSEIVPKVLARELLEQYPDTRNDISELASKNIQNAWRKK